MAIDVDTFYNLDLFQKGWYKLKISTVGEKCWETLKLPNGAKGKGTLLSHYNQSLYVDVTIFDNRG